MRKLFFLALSFLSWVNPMGAFSQEVSPERRVAEILVPLNKKKYLSVEVHGVRKEKYREIRTEPLTPADPGEYSGTYRSASPDCSVTVRGGSGGAVTATGYETSRDAAGAAHPFTLKDAKLEGALLTGTKLYGDASTDKFEGVFVKRTEFNSPADKGVASYGIAVLGPPAKGGEGREIIFYQRL